MESLSSPRGTPAEGLGGVARAPQLDELELVPTIDEGFPTPPPTAAHSRPQPVEGPFESEGSSGCGQERARGGPSHCEGYSGYEEGGFLTSPDDDAGCEQAPGADATSAKARESHSTYGRTSGCGRPSDDGEEGCGGPSASPRRAFPGGQRWLDVDVPLAGALGSTSGCRGPSGCWEVQETRNATQGSCPPEGQAGSASAKDVGDTSAPRGRSVCEEGAKASRRERRPEGTDSAVQHKESDEWSDVDTTEPTNERNCRRCARLLRWCGRRRGLPLLPQHHKQVVFRVCAPWMLIQVERRLPCLGWARCYARKLLWTDMRTGITVGVVLVPQAIAYALLAELPPTYGLYSSLLPLVVFAPLTSARHVSLGPFALISMLVADSVSQVVEPTQTEAYCEAVVLLSAMVGAIHLLMAVVRADFIVSLLSDPVLSGFTSAAAILIALSQLKHVVGFDVPRGTIFQSLHYVALHAGQTNPWALGVGLASFGGLKAFRKLNTLCCPSVRLPEQLIVVVLSVVFTLTTSSEGVPRVPTVGSVPPGLPAPGWPFKLGESGSLALNLVRPALLVAVFSYVLTISVAKPFALKFGYRVDTNQELVSLGMCNVVGSFFSAYPASASLSRSALVASLAGEVCTPAHGLWQAAVILLVVTLLTPAFEWLPYAALSAIIFCAVASLFDPGHVRQIARVSRADAALWVVAFATTLTLGVQLGILLSVGGSMLMIVMNSMRPHHAVLGRVPGTAVYRSRRLYPEARAPPHTLIFRWDASIHFANADHFRDSLLGHVRAYDAECVPAPPTRPVRTHPAEGEQRSHAPAPLVAVSEGAAGAFAQETTRRALHVIVLEFAGVNNVDTTGLRMLRDLVRELKERSITLIVSSCKSQVRQRLKASGLLDLLGEDNHFARVSEAAKYAEMLAKGGDTFEPSALSEGANADKSKRSSWTKLGMRMEQHLLSRVAPSERG